MAPAVDSHPVSRFFAGDAPVLQGRRTKSGELGPRFADDTWDLSVAVFRKNVKPSECLVNFGPIVDPIRRLTAKEFIYSVLNVQLRGSGRRSRPKSVLTARAYWNDLMMFWRFMDSRFGPMPLSGITQSMLDAYHVAAATNQITGAPVSKSRVLTKLELVQRLRTYQEYFTHDYISIAPWDGQRLSELLDVTGYMENLTPRIPEPILAPLLNGALRYVHEFSTEILAARREINTARARLRHTGSRATEPAPRLVRAWIAAQRAAGAGVPMHARGTRMHGRLLAKQARGEVVGSWDFVNLHRIANVIGIGYMTLYRSRSARSLILQAVDELGWEGDLDSPLPDESPTTLTALRGELHGEVLLIEERMLLVACYLVVAYLTGMRDSEVHSLRAGCHSIERSRDGTIHRHRLQGRVFKRRHPEGEDVEWVAIEPVVHAIHVVTELAEVHGMAELFTLPHGGGRGNTVRPWRLIDAFRDHLNRLAPRHPKLPRVPDEEGKPWKFNSMQLRRTLAWYIANRPYGIVALKIQYKHVDVAVSEGYAGTSEAGFAKEIEWARLEGRGDDLLERFRDFCDGVACGGPGAPRIEAEFSRIRAEIGGRFPFLVADQARVRAMLLNSEAVLFVGLYNDCYFVPAMALCQRETPEGKRPLPVLAICSPTRCPNSCFGPRHVEKWQSVAEEIREHLTNTRLGAPQRIALRQELERVEGVVSEIKDRNRVDL